MSYAKVRALLASCLLVGAAVQVQAQPLGGEPEAGGDAAALDACLNAWGQHPFGSRPVYTRLSTGVKISGVGPASADRTATDHPSLILVEPMVNVLGDASLTLANPNGWYCLRAPVNVLGALRIQLHCRARMAAASGGATVWGTGHAAPGVAVMGAIQVERIGCDGA